MRSTLGKVPGWLVNALGLRGEFVPNELRGPIVPVIDIGQGGFPYSQFVEWSLSTTGQILTGQTFLFGDMNYQYIIGACSFENDSLTTDALEEFVIIPPSGTGSIMGVVTNPHLDAWGSNGAGLNDFKSAPRWVPPGCSLGWIHRGGELGVPCHCDGFAYKIPAGFDVLPRGG